MTAFSMVCLFCEDIREEKSGQDTIIGTLPDNLHIAGLPPPGPTAIAMLPKLGIYLRINVFTDHDRPKDVSAKVLNTKGEIIAQLAWASSVIDKAFADAKANEMPLVGLLLKVVAGPIPITTGKIIATVTIDGTDYLAGAMNVILSSASPPPA
jgi:hypothetical protein